MQKQSTAKKPNAGNTIVFQICQPTQRSLKNHRPIKIAYGTELTIEEVRRKTGEVSGKKRVCMKRFMLRFSATKSEKSVLVPIGYDNPIFTSISKFVKNIVPVIPDECVACKKEIVTKAFYAKQKGFETAFQSLLTYSFTKQRYFVPADNDNVTHVGCDKGGSMYVKTENGNQYFIFNVAEQDKAKNAA